mgnify:CR=1 FL=1
MVDFFIPSKKVVDVVANDSLLCLIIMLGFVPDGIKQAQLGIVKALGIQKKAIKFSFVGNWILNLALVYYFCFTSDKWGLIGIWSAKLISEIFILSANTYLIESSDWKQIALDLQEKRDESF